MKDTHMLLLYLVFSLLAGGMVILFIDIASSPYPAISFSEKLGIAGLFILCCIIGILCTFRPNWLRRYIHKSHNIETNQQTPAKRSFQGHHPDCPMFQNHTIHGKEKTWCAGCLGLFIGLCTSILLMILYLLTNVQITNILSNYVIPLGFLMILVVYSEISYRRRSAVVHVVLNSILPVSFFLLTTAVGEITGQFVYGLFTLLLCLLWVDTRIQLSRWRHRILCEQCPEACKMFPDSI